MAEPTMSLGLRFRRHVAGWVMDSVPTPPAGELEALAARADAAERLAECCDSLNYIDYDEYLEALAAWRAFTGEVDG